MGYTQLSYPALSEKPDPNHIVSLLQVMDILDRHRAIRHLDLTGVSPGYADKAFWTAVLPCLQELTQLVVSGEELGGDTLPLFTRRMPALRSMQLLDVNLGIVRTGMVSISCFAWYSLQTAAAASYCMDLCLHGPWCRFA